MRSYVCAAALAACGVAVGAALRPVPAVAQVTERDDSVAVYSLEPIEVQGRRDDLAGTATSASVGFIGYRDLGTRPLTREGELLESVPGVILTQHSGGGKANQMFVRGFNLDHGTDFSVKIEGMPINTPTHGHAQGYADLNFLTPELVEHIEYSLGNYYAEIGDFSATGGAEFRLRRSLDRPIFELGAGENGHRRVLAAASTQVGRQGTLLVGGEGRRYDGPWDLPEKIRKLSGMARYTREGGGSTLSILGLAYHNTWNSTDQIPDRAVESGLIGRFGNLDPGLGGSTYRYSLSGSWDRAGRTSSQRINVYAIHYDLDLFSNSTYRLADPLNGDGLRQRDRGRWTLGGDAAHLRSFDWAGRRHALTVGSQWRWDRAHVTLAHALNRATIGVVRDDHVIEWSTGLYAQLVSHWSDVFRTTLGLRGDLYRFDVRSDRAENTGTSGDEIASPKLSLAFGPWGSTELYASAGLGFHSNDGRGAVSTVDPASGAPIEPVDPLVRSRGAEVGVRATPVEGLRSTISLWAIDLASELLFVGDAGTTEASDPSRRLGVTVANFYRVDERWTADLDVSVTRARFRDVPVGQDRVPGAFERVVTAGITYAPIQDGPLGAIRLRHLGAYPMIEDGSERAEPSSLVNLEVGYRLGGVRLAASILNLLDAKSYDIQYWYESRLSGEPAGGVADLHFHPAEPRQLRVSLSWGM